MLISKEEKQIKINNSSAQPKETVDPLTERYTHDAHSDTIVHEEWHMSVSCGTGLVWVCGDADPGEAAMYAGAQHREGFS